MIRGTFGFQILDRITKSVDTAIRHYFSEYMMIEGRSFGYVVCIHQQMDLWTGSSKMMKIHSFIL